MGICNSCESASVATAKLVFPDGAIREFASPVKVSHALDKNPAWFVCNSDEMEFDDFISAVDDDEELRIGQLYFALPVSWLTRRMRAEDMAALAVKASLAFKKGGGGGERGGCCCSKRVDHLVFFDEKYCKSRREVVAGGRGGGSGVMAEERRERSHNGNNSGRRRKVTKKLSMITEE
ncbi:uncharacterized protein LOC130779042 [Actinidia eriantha]|uniref:uncharacterized protein LOC130779042 n=1 Tax=Actinidia eriantha TaxID=165200 RepID=UPI00258D18E6|nr:uncharacterized protein LOC130779042 [Actinidia eriantha]